jgi:hypothetical protein
MSAATGISNAAVFRFMRSLPDSRTRKRSFKEEF